MSNARIKHAPMKLAFLCLLLLAPTLQSSTPASALAKSLRRYPYLTDLVKRHVTINWATTTSVRNGHVRYGRVSNHCRGRTARPHERPISVGRLTERQWRASLSRLAPGARYCYRVYGDGVALLWNPRSPRVFAALA